MRTLFYIVEGAVRLTIAKPGGTQVLLGLRRVGALLGGGAAVLGIGCWATGTAMEGCVVRPISLATFKSVNGSESAVTTWVQQALALDLPAHAETVAAFGGDSAERLAWYFADLARTASSVRPDGFLYLSDTPTHERLVEAIGVSREYVGRLVQRFKDEGVIRVEPGRYVIPKGSRLFDLV